MKALLDLPSTIETLNLMGYVAELPLLILTIAISSIWTLIAVPFLVPLLKKYLVDGGWGIATTVGWLATGTFIWFAAHLGIPVNTQSGVFLVTFGLLAAAVWKIRNHKQELLEFIKQKKVFIITQEALFAFGFLLMSFIRGFKPDILDLEKFMDAGFIKMYMHSPTLPAPDMWLAGYTINYYTFGQFLGSVATQLWSQPIEIGYNLILALLMGLLFRSIAGLTFSIVASIVGNKTSTNTLVIAGLSAAFLVVLGGNSHKAWYGIKNSGFSGYWYPDATRFIHNTIHEFPAYSFVVSDLHAHVFSLPLVMVLITCIFVWAMTLKTSQKLEKFLMSDAALFSILTGTCLGLVASTSTWDTLIYGMFLVIMSLIFIMFNVQFLPWLFYSAIIIGFSTLFASAPWWLNFESISDGAELVSERSELWKFLVLWTGHGVVTLFSIGVTTWLVLKHKPSKHMLFRFIPWIKTKNSVQLKALLFSIAISVTALVLLLLPELFYMKDIYPDHPRANTMFKLTFQSLVLMSMGAGLLLGTTLHYQLKNKIMTGLSLLLVSTLIIVAAIYPYGAFKSYYGFTTFKNLNGLEWLEKQHPDDMAAIQWLDKTLPAQNRPVIAEAVGESYTTFGRVSAFTGMPTILGWRVHEWLWRGSFDIPGERTPEVDTIYSRPSSPEAITLLSKYQVKYIFVGDKEREAYVNIDEIGLKQLGKVAFSSGNTYIVELE